MYYVKLYLLCIGFNYSIRCGCLFVIKLCVFVIKNMLINFKCD